MPREVEVKVQVERGRMLGAVGEGVWGFLVLSSGFCVGMWNEECGMMN